ncbi:AfsR/SARP family transcriptional regulator [Nonomuraea recticatena]|uniref:AfsR/SARP family transcriptional regulator n=2 Tax=Nonomuraea recticatena TaxID=46178 RepID=UPI00360CCF76
MEFRLLGPVEVWDQGRQLPIGGPKPRALLAALLLGREHVVSVDRLVDSIWSADAPDAARGLIQTYVSMIRRTLGPRTIETHAPGYLLRIGTGQLDLHQFDRLVAEGRRAAAEGRREDAARAFLSAEALWRGPALGGIGDVLQPEAARLDELRLTIVEERISVELLLDRHTELVPTLAALVSAHPTKERLRGQLMTALYRLGRSAEALALYEDGRAALAEELGIDPGPELRALHQAILRSDPSLSSQASPYPGRPIPAQLPRDVPDFAGRTDTIADLKPLLGGQRTAPPLLVLSGQGGVGKSACAIHLAHRVAEFYPDGQLFADLRGTSDNPATEQEVLGRFLGALGIEPATQPESPQDRGDLYRSLLAKRQVLVLLDDARNEQQIRPLLPGGAGCAVMITSRRRLAGLAGAHLTDLDVLDGEAALALLGAVAGAGRVAAEPQTAREIVRLCGSLPLAVRTVGARLATRRHWSLAAMAARLADERRRLDELTVGDVEVRASVGLSYRLLDEQARTAFRRLGLLGVPSFSPWILAPLLEIPPDDADDIAERLVDAQLMNFVAIDAVGQPRYRLHELVRVFAQECAEADDPEAERTAAVSRALRTWLWLIERFESQVPSGEITLSGHLGSSLPADALVADRVVADPGAWLEAETPALIVAVARAAAMGLTAACALAAALSFSESFVANRLAEWGVVHQTALGAARRTGNHLAEAALHAGMGQISYRLDRFDQSCEHLRLALPLFEAAGHVRGKAVVLAGLGSAYREQCRLREGLEHLTASALIFRGLGDDLAIGATARMAASIHLELGEYVDTWLLLSQAIDAYRRAGSDRGQALTLRTTSLVHRALGDYAAASDLSRQALDLFRRAGDPLMIAFGVQALVKAEIRQGRGTDYLSSIADALEVCRSHFDRYGEALMQRTIGEVHLALGQLELAEAHLMQSIAISEELHTPLPAARARRDLAALWQARGDAATAKTQLAEAMTTFATYGAREYAELAQNDPAPAESYPECRGRPAGEGTAHPGTMYPPLSTMASRAQDPSGWCSPRTVVRMQIDKVTEILHEAAHAVICPDTAHWRPAR